MIDTTRWLLSIQPFLLTCLSTAYVLAIGTMPVRAESVIGLTSTNTLVTFDSSTPGVVSAAIPITGVGAETIFDIDRRPANGLLYGLGSAGNLYLINPTTGSAILNAALTGVNLDPNATRFGIDFNPTVDRLRIVSNTGENLRLNPDTGATTVDGPLNGAASGAVSVAYTNNDTDPATGTTLFYIGPSTPTSTFNTFDPNGGVLNLVGAMGVTGSQNVGFDISGLSGLAYASLSSPFGGNSSLYPISLTTGAASLVGTIGASTTLRGIALSTGAIPEPTSLVLFGVGLVTVAISTLRQRCRRSARK